MMFLGDAPISAVAVFAGWSTTSRRPQLLIDRCPASISQHKLVHQPDRGLQRDRGDDRVGAIPFVARSMRLSPGAA
jgi:hypothetical protein